MTAEAREAVGMKPLKVRGIKDAPNAIAYIRARNDGGGVSEVDIARGLRLSDIATSEATRYLERHGKVLKVGEDRVRGRVWPVARWVIGESEAQS